LSTKRSCLSSVPQTNSFACSTTPIHHDHDLAGMERLECPLIFEGAARDENQVRADR
jgi:hypothetical protein